MSNRLKYESSPYLLQHAENPVDWYPWGKEDVEFSGMKREKDSADISESQSRGILKEKTYPIF